MFILIFGDLQEIYDILGQGISCWF